MTEYLFFWGHRPLPDGRIGKPCLSQWWPADFTVDGELYPTAEHFMMVGKARLFSDEQTAAKIFEAATPDAAKSLGRKVKGFDDSVWTEHRYDIVVRGTEAKFSQNPRLHGYLVGTGNASTCSARP